jgi:hypothetical protein
MNRDRGIAAGLFVATAGAYLWTLCPSVYVEGSGELIGATWWLGTPHPTGYPLYALLGRLLAASMPVASPAPAVNAATALLSAAAAPAMFLLLRERHLTRAAAATAAVALVFGRTFWSQAVVAEVYGLFVLSVVLLMAASLRARRSGPMRNRWLFASGYLGGIAATCHLQAVLLLPIALGGAVWQGTGQLKRLRADVLRVFCGGLCGASLLLYLVLRNGVGPGFHWGPLNSLPELWDHVTGALYRSSFILPPLPILAGTLARLASQLANEWPSVLLPVIGWGVVAGWRRDRALVVLVLGAVLINLVAGLVYHRDPAGIHVFFLLLIVGVCILLGEGLNDVEQSLRHRLPLGVSLLIPVVCAVGVFTSNSSVVDRSEATLPDAYGRQLLRELPEGAILLTDGDDASYIVDYLHRVEGVRADVQIYHRMGRGTDLGAEAPTEPQRAQARRKIEASLLRAGRIVHFLVPRMMPAEGFDFLPQGLSYRAVRSEDGVAPLPIATSIRPTQLLSGAWQGNDPWVDKLAANCWYMEAEALRASGDIRAAIDAYERAARTAPRSISMNYNVSLNLLQLNEVELATEFANRAMGIDPLRRGPYKLAAEILSRSGAREAAREVHKRALEWGRIP